MSARVQPLEFLLPGGAQTDRDITLLGETFHPATEEQALDLNTRTNGEVGLMRRSLDDRVITPFEETLEQGTLDAAEEQGALDRAGNVLEEFRHEFPFETVVIRATFSRTRTTTKYELLLKQSRFLLAQMLRKNARDEIIEGVRRHDGEVYVHVPLWLKEVATIRDDPLVSTPSISTSYSFLTPDLQPMQLDAGIERVSICLRTYTVLSQHAVETYFKARSMDVRLKAWEDRYAAFIKGRFGAAGETTIVETTHDDTSVTKRRVQESERTRYGGIYKCLYDVPEKDITANTGDIVMLDRLALDTLPYRKKTSGGELSVTAVHQQGMWEVTIRRTPKVREPITRTYAVFLDGGKTYVRIADILKNQEMLRQSMYSTVRSLHETHILPLPDAGA